MAPYRLDPVVLLRHDYVRGRRAVDVRAVIGVLTKTHVNQSVEH